MLLLFISFLAFANDQIIVTATREEESTRNLPFSVESISGEEWKEGGALTGVAGIASASNGGPGQTKSILLRGAKSEHLLVLIDGIVVNDPLSPSRGFDFSQIPAEDIDRVEIIKGPQSVLFGSDAMAGVIQIFTKRNVAAPRIAVEGGSYATGKAQISAYGFRAGFERSDGFSAADKKNGNEERDGYKVYRIGGVKDFSLGERTTFRNTAFFSDSTVQTDRSGGVGGDSRNTFTRNNRVQFRSELMHVFENGIDASIAGSANIIDREDNTSGAAFYLAHLWKVESLWRKSIGIHDFVLGAEYAEESGRSTEIPQKKTLSSYGVFLQDHFVRDSLHVSVGARIDFPSEQGNPQTYRAGLGYWFVPEKFRAKINLGTGFKAPSLYQTFSSYGSRGLRPEKSLGGDFGLEYILDKFEFEILWYQNIFRNLIEFDSNRSKYYNIGKAETYGMELTASAHLGRWSLQNAFTTTRAIDKNTAQPLLRRPEWSNTLSGTWNMNERWGISSHIRMVGPREDLHPVAFSRQNMPAFFVMGANGKWRFAETASANFRIENLLNRYYQEVSGYGTAGFSAYTGLQMDL